MSFVKKFMTPNSKRVHTSTSSSSRSPNASSSNQSREKTDVATEKSDEKSAKKTMIKSTDTSQDEPSDLVDLFVIQTSYQMKRDDLNQQFDKVRRMEKKMNILKSGVTQLCLETEEINRVLAEAEEQFPVLLKEFLARREELEEKFKIVVDKTKESEIKKREPIMYKKCMAVKTVQDVTHYLNLIQSKQRTLLHLELLALRKHANLQQNIVKATQKASTSDKSRPKAPGVPKKPPKDSNIQSMYQELLKTFVQLGPLGPNASSSSSIGLDNSSISMANSNSEIDQTTAVADLFATDIGSEQREATSNDAAPQEVTLTLESEV